MRENWARAAGFPAYEVSTAGRVRRWHTKKLCGIWPDSCGYSSVSLQRAGRWLKPQVHVLVWRTFRGPVALGREIDHRDERRDNPRLTNLRTLTVARNRQRQRRACGAGSRYRGVIKLAPGRWRAQIRASAQRHYLGTYATQRQAALAYDRAARRLHGCCAVLNFGRVA